MFEMYKRVACRDFATLCDSRASLRCMLCTFCAIGMQTGAKFDLAAAAPDRLTVVLRANVTQSKHEPAMHARR